MCILSLFQVLSEQKDICGWVWSLWFHPWTHRLPSQHTGTGQDVHTCFMPVSGQTLYWFCQQVGMGLGLIWFVLWLQIIHTDSNTVLGQNDTGFSCDGSANTFRVMFKEPVEILPNVNYTACATLKVCVASLPLLKFGFCSLFHALCLLHRVQIPIMVLKECERSRTSLRPLAQKRVSPSATQRETTMALRWRTDRSLRSSSIHSHLHHVSDLASNMTTWKQHRATPHQPFWRHHTVFPHSTILLTT